MAEIRLTTAGITMGYAVETTANTRPTAGYTDIPELVSIPEISTTPETVDMTPLSATRYKIYANGLIDPGGALSFTANFSQPELTLWNGTIVPAYEKGIADGKRMWFCVIIPGFTQAFYFPGVPSKIGLPPAAVGSGLQVTLPITMSDEPDWYAVPTDAKTASLD